MKKVAFVPIRLNSQRIEQKNLRPLGHRPLMTYLLESLAAAKNMAGEAGFIEDAVNTTVTWIYWKTK